MVVRIALVAVSLLLCSCSSVFDSYFSPAVEYLETQTDLSGTLGGHAVASVQLGYLPAGARSTDLLVVVAATQDGASHVLFYNPTNLSLVRSYGNSELQALGGGTVPNLGLITQDSSAIYTGVVPYDPQTLNPGAVFLPSYFSTSSTTPNFSNVRAVYDPTQSAIYLYSVAGTTLNEYTAATYPGITNVAATTQTVTNTSYLNLFDAVSSGGRFYVLATSGGQIYLMNAPNASAVSLAASVVPAFPASLQGSGWATATAAIAEGHADNAFLLQAYSWSGQKLSSLSIPQNNDETLSVAFQPNGQSWYLFESSTGKLSREKPWW